MLLQRENLIEKDFEFLNVQLSKLKADHITQPDDEDSDEYKQVQLRRNWEYTFKFDNENKVLNLYVNFELTFVPIEIAELSAEYKITYEFKGDSFEEAFVHEHAEDFAMPCVDINTLLIGHITDKLLGASIIVPPIARFEKDSKKEDK